MRLITAGILFFSLVSTTLAGLIGKVDTIGLGSFIRQDCTVPIIVSITSDSQGPESYGLQVVQYDLDGDEVAYTRPIVVNPGTQSYWTYFKPQSINSGLPSMINGKSSADLAKELRIFITSVDGTKRLVQVSTASKIPQVLEGTDQEPGSKLLLCVGRPPNISEFDPGMNRVLGLREYLQFMPLDTGRLPDNVMGYESVDYVVWTDADPDKLDAAQFRALRQFVQSGGKLVVIQNTETARMARLDDFLPVIVQRAEATDTFEHLKSILTPTNRQRIVDPNTQREINQYVNLTPPFHIVKAIAKSDAIVDMQFTWPDKTKTPFIARRLYGQGMVAWVAQDITEPNLRSLFVGWPRFWNQLLDLKADTPYHYIYSPQVAPKTTLDIATGLWKSAGVKDLGYTFTQRLDLESKTATLITLALLFFIGYWIVAGPLLHVVLAVKKQTSLSWFIYGAIAILATLLTVGVAEIVLRGSPQIKHVSLVRSRSDGADPARVFSRFGLYVPRDEPNLNISLTNRENNGLSMITPLSKDPRYSEKNVSPRDSKYAIPIQNEDAGEEIVIGVPFRSTLKKLQSEWTGKIEGRIFGTPRLTNTRGQEVAGTLTNNTGRTIYNVYIVFPSHINASWEDNLIYLREWPAGKSFDLADLCDQGTKFVDKLSDKINLGIDNTTPITKGTLNQFNKWLVDGFRMRMIGNDSSFNDSSDSYRKSFPLVSLYDRIEPLVNVDRNIDRVDLLRRGVHNWDCSHALAAGAMVVIGQTPNDAIPLPLDVDGARPDGNGTTFWQFIIPLDHSQVKIEAIELNKEEKAN